jgi:Protein of unknown function (DUF3987)
MNDQLNKFMGRVVPWPANGEAGYINLHWFGNAAGFMRGRPFTDLKGFLNMAQWGAVHPEAMNDIYFCLTRQSAKKMGKTGKEQAVRRGQNATHAKALWIDADVKSDQPEKNYTSTDTLLTALQKFLADADLPAPSALVASGSGGLHIYWISNRALTIKEWRPYADGLKALITKHGFKCDAGLTTDSARVLRVPGTLNRKRDPATPVVLIGLGGDYDFATELAHLAATLPVVTGTVTTAPAPQVDAQFLTPAAAAFGVADPNDSLAAGLNVRDDRPLDVEGVIRGCEYFADLATNHGRGVGQGLWMQGVLACTFLDQGRRLAHYFSNGYATYSHAETEAMYERKIKDRAERGLGWPGCAAFENEGCKLCATCANKGKIKSPLNLAVRLQAPAAQQSQLAPPAHASFVDPYCDFAGPAFPIDVLPPTLAKFVDAQHRAMGADPSAIAMAVLTAVAGAIHAETAIRAGGGWWEKPILWTALVGQPSTMKSPIIDKARKPLSGIDNERHKLWQQTYKTWQQLTQKMTKMPPPAKPARCIINDATPEKVAEILSRDPSGALMVHDELAGWLDGFERYNSGQSSRAFYLSSWNGGPHLKDRVGKGKNDPDAETRVDNLALCILGGIQPDKLAELHDLTSDGLLQRVLPVLMVPAERGNEYHPVAIEEADYEKLIKATNAASPEKYHFAEDALEVRDRVNDDLHKLELIDGFPSALIGAIGKLKGYFARICLVLHVAKLHDPMAIGLLTGGFTLPEGLSREQSERAFGPYDPDDCLSAGLNGSIAISRGTAEAVEKVLRQFLLQHMFSLYDVVVNGGRDRDMVRSIGDFILAFNKDRIRPSDVTAGVRKFRGQPEPKIRECMGRFCAMGWLESEDEKPGVPPKAWRVAPGLREHFAKRRKQAQEAREAAHAILKAGGSRAAA